MTPGARFFTRRRLLTNTGRVASVGLWLALFLGLLYLTPIVPKAVLSAEFEDKDDKPCVLAFSPDGKTVVTIQLHNFTNAYGPLHFWDVEKNQERLVVAVDGKQIDALEFSPDGHLVVAGTHDRLKFLPDGRWDRAATRHNGFMVWDSQSGRQRADYIADGSAGLSEFEYARFAPDSTCLVLCHFNPNGLARRKDLWDIESQQLLKTEGAVSDVVFSGDGKEMLVVLEPSTDTAPYPIVRWSATARRRGTWAKVAMDARGACAFSPDFQSIWVCPRQLDRPKGEKPSEYEIRILHLTTGHQTDSIRLGLWSDEVAFCWLSFSKAGRFVMANGLESPESSRTVVVRVDQKLAQAGTIKGLPIFSWDDQFLLERDGTGATLYETAGMTRCGELRMPGDSELTISWAPGAIPARWEHGTYPFAPDNKTVVLTRLVRTRTNHPALAWLAPYFTTAPSSQTVECARLWDVETCTELACFDDCIQALYSPDGKTLATAHTDGKVRLWDVPPRKPVLAILGMSLVLWLSVLVAIRLWVRGTKGGQAKLLGRLFRYYRRVPQ